MKRTYSKRKVSTSAKTYDDYIKARESQLAKGYNLKSEMTKIQFTEAYKLFRTSKRKGEFKGGAFDELMKRERYLNNLQAERLAKAASEMYGKLIRPIQLKKMAKDEVRKIGDYLNIHKYDDSLFGGSYE